VNEEEEGKERWKKYTQKKFDEKKEKKDDERPKKTN